VLSVFSGVPQSEEQANAVQCGAERSRPSVA